MQARPRLLYLGHAFPPGVADRFPELQPAGHYIETSLVRSLQTAFDVRSVGINPVDVARLSSPRTDAPGLPHDLNLLDRPPELFHRWNSLRRLRAAYADWQRSGWTPDVVLVCNFTPVFNAFVRRLVGQPQRPRLVLYLADSTQLGHPLTWTKRLRYRLKPMKWLDDDMAGCFDACVAVSRDTRQNFASRQVPWLWLPNGVLPERARDPWRGPASGPIVFCYFGMLGEHTGAPALLRVFRDARLTALLRVCGWGKSWARLEAAYGGVPGVSFHGPLTPDACLEFALGCDVLVNPRPILPGNENNFSSKVFEYGLAGRSILTSRLSGLDEVLGEAAYYFEAAQFDVSLRESLMALAGTSRAELRRRGAVVQQRLLEQYSWAIQGGRLAGFLRREVLGGG